MVEITLVCGHFEGDQWEHGPSYSGRIDLHYYIKNLGEKTIKYADIYCVAYNSVNDQVICYRTGNGVKVLTFTGPLNQNEHSACQRALSVWYNDSIQNVRIRKVEISYTDGSSETIQGSEISPIQSYSHCYVATAVYGSYDCPQVWTLRRFRDYTLAETWYGRAFIRTYYAISPTLVKWFGHTEWFKKMWKGKLDRMVANLNAEGVENTPYEDRNW